MTREEAINLLKQVNHILVNDEHYIQEIISEKIKVNPYTNKPCCVVKMIVDCYGNTSEVNTIFDAEEWGRIKKQGYYLG